MQTEPVQENHVPASEADKAAIREQLDRLLLDPAFKNSKRYPSFLRFVVAQALQGEADSLKERILGVEIFGRSPDYDSTQDPIVRVTAAEIRKRIIRYYEDPQHQSEVRVLLPSGTYVPHFEFPDLEVDGTAFSAQTLAYHGRQALRSQDATVQFPVGNGARLSSAKSTGPTHSSILGKKIAAFACVVLLLFTGWALWLKTHRSPVDAFWGPVLSDPTAPVLLCIADQSRYAVALDPKASQADQANELANAPTLMAAEDTLPLLDFVNIVRPRARSFKVQVEGQTNFSDLGHGPSILIGAFDNKWTLFLTDPLRFHFAGTEDQHRLWIEDRQAPAKRDWAVDAAVNHQGTPRKDYALVARFVDTNTNQVTVVVAGLGHFGTLAAGEFVVSPEALKDLETAHPDLLKSRNFEIVLDTLIVNGHAGPANIDAVYTW